MWFLRVVKGIGRFLLDVLFLLAGLIIAAMVFNAVGLVWAIVISLPVWLCLAWIYRILLGPRKATA